METNDGIIIRCIRNITSDKLIKLSMLTIILWLLGPIVAIIMNVIGIKGTIIYRIWAMFVYVCGGLGWFTGFSYLFQITEKRFKNDNISKKELVDYYLPIIVIAIFWIWLIICSVMPDVDWYFAFVGYVPNVNTVLVYFLYFGFTLSALVLSTDKKHTVLVVDIFLAVACVLCLITLPNNEITHKLTYIEGQTLPFWYTTREYVSVFANANHFGYYLNVAILACNFMLLAADSKKKTLIYLLAFVILVNTLILNDTFGAELACFLVLVFVVIWKLMNKESKKLKSIFLLLLFIGICFASLSYTNAIKDNVFSLFGDFSTIDSYVEEEADIEEINEIGSLRGELWVNSIKSILHDPIFGNGMQHGGYYEGRKAHNVFLTMGVYAGIPGIILFISIFVCGAVRLIKYRKTINQIEESAAFVLVGYLISDFFGLQEFYTSPYLLLALGLCIKPCFNGLIDEK